MYIQYNTNLYLIKIIRILNDFKFHRNFKLYHRNEVCEIFLFVNDKVDRLNKFISFARSSLTIFAQKIYPQSWDKKMNELLKLKRVGENNIGTLKKRHKRSHEPLYKTNEKLSKEKSRAATTITKLER